MIRSLAVLSMAAASLFAATAVEAATVTYNSLVTYQGATGATVLDTYSAAGYAVGDVSDGAGIDIHTDAHMSAVVGETDYKTTGFTNHNIIFNEGADAHYCAGCNGSFELGFTTTSVGTASGVFGVGLNFINTDPGTLYHAFVTFGDGSTADYALPLAADAATYTDFWGVTSDLSIKTIDFGLANGGVTQGGAFAIDNLRISDSPSAVPEPTSMLLIGSGLATLFVRRRRRS